MASLLVIGGSGFFGKSILDAFIRGLLEKWGINELNLLSRNSTKLRDSHPELINSSVNLFDQNICDCNHLPYADYIIHAAASTEINGYINTPESQYNNIINGVANYCKLAKTLHSTSKILYVSSGAVYGQQPYKLSALKEDFPYRESVDEMMIGKRIYTLAKRDCEKMFSMLGQEGLNTCIARCFSFIGYYLPRDQHFAIGNFLNDAISNNPIRILAKGAVYRSYMYADDLVDWLLSVLFLSSNKCPVFNIGSDEAISIHELALKIANLFSLKIITNNDTDNLTDVDRYIPSVEKAKRHGMQINFDLDSAIAHTILKINQNKK
jgi:nucleoside-diphosphate-sugar epimerase